MIKSLKEDGWWKTVFYNCDAIFVWCHPVATVRLVPHLFVWQCHIDWAGAGYLQMLLINGGIIRMSITQTISWIKLFKSVLIQYSSSSLIFIIQGLVLAGVYMLNQIPNQHSRCCSSPPSFHLPTVKTKTHHLSPWLGPDTSPAGTQPCRDQQLF